MEKVKVGNKMKKKEKEEKIAPEKEFLNALDNIVKEKQIDRETVLEAMELALTSAYKKHTGKTNGKATVNRDTGEIKVFSYVTVVEEVLNPDIEISLSLGGDLYSKYGNEVKVNMAAVKKLIDGAIVNLEWYDRHIWRPNSIFYAGPYCNNTKIITADDIAGTNGARISNTGPLRTCCPIRTNASRCAQPPLKGLISC